MTSTYRFGRCELRPATRELLVDEQPAVLGARAFNLLLALIERRDRLVGKDELLDVVWPGLVVEENNLQVQVSTLRRLLGPDAITTVAGYGYRFALEATEIAAAPSSLPLASIHNLPVQVASFIGRARELIDLRALLARSRFVTLTGVGGIGKTRLAVQLGTLVADAHADGVWFVDLAPITDQRLVANAVASTLAVREEPGRPVLETLLKFVHDRALLLLLDNCEHLLQACAQLTRDLLHAGQRLTVVATSREPLHVAGEATYPLPTLPTPDPRAELSLEALSEFAAVQLFVDRAVAVRRDFALTQHNAASVARICHDLDGIPLAIELAAARMRALSAEVIAGHLIDRFRLLKSGDVTALPRHQTLRATIDWSYELLEPPERVLLQRLSVFAGGFVFDAAQAVGAGGEVAQEDVLELLANLVDKSLVAFDAASERYKLLETVRQYAQERLAASGDEAATRDRHLAYYVALAGSVGDELRGPRQAVWGARLDAERENILLAFAHARIASGGAAAGLAMVYGFNPWYSWKDFDIWRGVILEALAHPDAQPEDLARCRALNIASYITFLTGRNQEAFDLGQACVAIARRLGAPDALADGLGSLGTAAMYGDRQAEALAFFTEGREAARQAGTSWLIANMGCGLGELYTQQGQLELAEAPYLDSLDHSRHDPTAHALALCNLARNAIALGAGGKAVEYLRQAVVVRPPLATVPQGLLTDFAGLAVLREEWTLALRFAGAARAQQERYRLWFDVVDARFHERDIASARAALGAIAADAAFEEGKATGVDQMLREGEAWLRSLPAD